MEVKGLWSESCARGASSLRSGVRAPQRRCATQVNDACSAKEFERRQPCIRRSSQAPRRLLTVPLYLFVDVFVCVSLRTCAASAAFGCRSRFP
eukprot:6184556-Pleurochrysis_carterae.AAC.5